MLCPSQLHNYDLTSTRRARVGTLALLLAALILAIGCLSTCSRYRDPQVALDHAKQTYERGDMMAVTEQAEKGYSEFGRISAEWAWQFAILRARGVYRRGMYDRALDLLASEPSPPSSGDLAVQKQRLEAAIYASLFKFPEAEQRIREAQRLCTTDYPACRDIDATL